MLLDPIAAQHRKGKHRG
ncbi:hypothetical protein [Lysobacter enzymogenes]